MEHLSHPPEQHWLCMYFNEALCLPTYSPCADRERVSNMLTLCHCTQSHNRLASEIYSLDSTLRECVCVHLCEDLNSTNDLLQTPHCTVGMGCKAPGANYKTHIAFVSIFASHCICVCVCACVRMGMMVHKGKHRNLPNT